MNTHSEILKWTVRAAIASGALIAVLGIASVVFQIKEEPIDSSVQFSIFIILLSAVFFYLVKAVDKIATDVESLNVAASAAPTVVYRDSETFFEALATATMRSSAIHTHMLSDPPKNLGRKASEYFDAVHGRLLSSSDCFNVFRRIATVHSPEKATWVIDTLVSLKSVTAFSLAIQYVDDGYPQTSLHLAMSPARQVLFVWVTMTSGGFGQGFSVNDGEVAAVMKEEHDREFFGSIPLKTRDDLHWANIKALADRFGLQDHPSFVASMASKA